jgi:hypothetical protein
VRKGDLPLQVTVIEERDFDPILRADPLGAFSEGLHSIDLSTRGVELEANVEYRWFASLIVDRERPSRISVAAGALRRVPDSDPRREFLDQALPTERETTMHGRDSGRTHSIFFASIAAAHPDFGPVVRHRARLVELAGAKPLSLPVRAF